MRLPLSFSLVTASQIFTCETSWQTSIKELQYDNLRWRNPLETDHMIWPQSPQIKRSAPLMLDHIKSGADFTTTCLTTFRTGLPGDSSTRRTLYQFFRTKKHALDAILRKKPYPFAWGNRGRKLEYCHSDQKSIEKRCFSMLFCTLFYLVTQLSERCHTICYAILWDRAFVRRILNNIFNFLFKLIPVTLPEIGGKRNLPPI